MKGFVDHVQIEVKAGHGGAGSVSYRREKFIPRGGPDGGNGGKGGDIIIKGVSGLRTLLEYRYKKIFCAKNGDSGSGSLRHGRDGKNLVIPVPVGTMVLDSDTGGLIADIKIHEQQCVVASGGRGGKGNAHFKSATHQTPRFSQPGEAGGEKKITLELKLLADIGLVGFPNAGKSTLVAKISAAKPKIADYPFTTLIPSLGVVNRGPDRIFVVADIPGIIEGSHTGRGLGHQFLRHIERSAALMLLIDVSPLATIPPSDAPAILLKELDLYKLGITHRVSAIVATKIDALASSDILIDLGKVAANLSLDFLQISAATGQGVRELLDYMERQFHQYKSDHPDV